MLDCDDYFVREPSSRRRKYRFRRDAQDNNLENSINTSKHQRQRWTILLSFVSIEEDERKTPETESEACNAAAHPPSCAGPASPLGGGHKASFRATKLARRARSFKDDFLGKISQMRSPAAQARAQSPAGKRGAATAQHNGDLIVGGGEKGPVNELNTLWKQTQVALRHLRDVVSKSKLEMLPGNGTIVLDTVWLINLAVKSSVSGTQSSALASATGRMYQSVARLIKLCDDALIDSSSGALEMGNVEEVVAQVEDAVQALIVLAQEKILASQHPGNSNSYTKTAPRNSYCSSAAGLDVQSQRNSLPDIPLTPREREILEQTACRGGVPVRTSHSTESVLRESSPPPKPPLPPQGLFFSLSNSEPDNRLTPPPLPPKKKNNKLSYLVEHCYSNENSPVATSLERVSMRSKSPEDSMSLLSASADSLDSMLDQSRDEEEIKAIMDNNSLEGCTHLENHISDILGINTSTISWEESSLSSSLSTNHDVCQDYHRLSNTDSGISYSTKRSSQQSTVSGQWTAASSSSRHLSTSSSVTTTTVHQETHQMVAQMQRKAAITSVQRGVPDGRDELDDAPPAIPAKTRKRQSDNRQSSSPYDNINVDGTDGNTYGGELLVACEKHQNQDSQPPPLPPKKKHMFQSVAYSVMAYMEMIGNCSHAAEQQQQEFTRHSVHMVQSHYVGPPSQSSIPSAQSCSFAHSQSISASRFSHTSHHNLTLAPPPTDPRISSPLRSPLPTTSPQSHSPPALPPKHKSRSSRSPPPTPPEPQQSPQGVKATLPDLLEHTAAASPEGAKGAPESPLVSPCDVDLMEELNVDEYLVMKKPEEEGPEIRGGPIDALIIQATKATKNGEEKENVFTYQEAFLTTYRTFIAPLDLIRKLIRRYNHFYYQPDKKPRSREAFALIVRVVVDLTVSDLEDELQSILMSFVQQLIGCGELTLAKALRVKHLERHEAKQAGLRQGSHAASVISSLSLSARNLTLLDFKADQIAEQMTLLDAELFMKIEIPEVLIWAQEQCEERSPNLTRFTEHFNKMSYWARTRILMAEGKETREKYFLKFIKIMKHLRKINNFNSYLALLSALDSAPVRRLEWQRQVQEGLKEYCALIDSSSSFRAYRQALAETQPPCIPYIGLVLQDLTFVHIGNSNLLPDSSINFSKRWQQFNIVENMKKFKKCSYLFKKNERIIQFFQNFNDCISEDAMWQLSESIKPRGSGKKVT